MLVMAELVEQAHHLVTLADNRPMSYLRDHAPRYYKTLIDILHNQDDALKAQFVSFGIQSAKGSIVSYTKGLPSSGRTKFISIIATLFTFLFNH